jgi:hypothetical protein
MVLTEQQKKELYDAIDYDEDKDSIEDAVNMPKDVSIEGSTVMNLISNNQCVYAMRG